MLFGDVLKDTGVMIETCEAIPSDEKKRASEMMKVFEHPLAMMRSSLKNYMKDYEEIRPLIIIAKKDFEDGKYEKSGYMWGEITAIVIWGDNMLDSSLSNLVQ